MLKIFAPAKINLHLHVTGKRPDGYHLLDSLVCFSDCGDTLIFESADSFEFHVEGRFASDFSLQDKSISPDSCNSVVKAARLLSETLARELNVKITLQKNLPLGAGIGGGSADAAACLLGLCQFWSIDLSDEYLCNMALKIGSDVPVCLKSHPLIMRGIGEIIEPAPDMPELPCVLIWPNQHVPTPSVFKNMDVNNFSQNAQLHAAYADPKQLAEYLLLYTHNNLEPIALELFPIIEDALNILREEKNCHLARMSGSGSTVLGIFESEDDSKKAVEKIQAAYPDWWVQACWLNRTVRY